LFIPGNSVSLDLEKTVTTLSDSGDDGDNRASLQSADFTRVTGSLFQSSGSNSTSASLPNEYHALPRIQSTTGIQCAANSRQSSNIEISGPALSVKSTMEQRLLTQSNGQIVESCSDTRDLVLSYTSDENVLRENKQKENGCRTMYLLGKENVEPSPEILPKSTQERVMKKFDFISSNPLLQTARYILDSDLGSLTLNGDSGIASCQNSLRKTPQSSLSAKSTKNSIKITSNADRALQRNGGDSERTLLAAQNLLNRQVTVTTHETTVSCSPDHSGFGTRNKSSSPPIKTSDDKFSRSSSTPIKEVINEHHRDCTDSFTSVGASVIETRPVHNGRDKVKNSGQDSYAYRLSTGSLTDSSYSDVDMTYESTVQLSLPSRFTRPESSQHKVGSTTTTLLPECPNTYSMEHSRQQRTESGYNRCTFLL